jgi:Uma2 family endonuclease
MATAATMSGKQFDDLPYDEGRRWELQDGELIPVSGATPRHQAIVSRLVHLLQDYLEANAAGGLAIPDVEFALSDVLRLRPDVCVLLPEKAGRLDPDLIPVPGAPDIAIEVISPSERAA